MGGCYVDLVTYGAGLQTFMPIQAVITLHNTNIVRSVIDRGLKVLCFVQEATECGKTKGHICNLYHLCVEFTEMTQIFYYRVWVVVSFFSFSPLIGEMIQFD